MLITVVVALFLIVFVAWFIDVVEHRRDLRDGLRQIYDDLEAANEEACAPRVVRRHERDRLRNDAEEGDAD
jgi:hypothetical protein